MRISDWSSDVCSSDLQLSEEVILSRSGALDTYPLVGVQERCGGRGTRLVDAADPGGPGDVAVGPARADHRQHRADAGGGAAGPRTADAVEFPRGGRSAERRVGEGCCRTVDRRG